MFAQPSYEDLLTAAKVATQFAVWADARSVADAKRRVVVDFLHYNGQFRVLLDEDEWKAVAGKADGFGEFSSFEALEALLGGDAAHDWSHVRDSSGRAFEAMFSVVVALVGDKIAAELERR